MRKRCSSVKRVRLLSCPLTAPAMPQYQSCYNGESDLLRMFLAVIQYAKCRRTGPALPPPLPPNAPCVWRDTPAFWYFLSSVLLCILCSQLPSNSVRRAQHFLCPTSSAGAAYPVQSSTTSERVFLHPKSIINTAKVFITLRKLWTLMASGVRGKAVRVNFMRKSLHLLSATECELQFSQEPSQWYLGDNTCIPVLPRNLKLWNPLYQMWVLSGSCFFGSLVVMVPSSSTSTDFPFPAPQSEQSSSNHDPVLLLEARSHWGHKCLPESLPGSGAQAGTPGVGLGWLPPPTAAWLPVSCWGIKNDLSKARWLN